MALASLLALVGLVALPGKNAGASPVPTSGVPATASNLPPSLVRALSVALAAFDHMPASSVGNLREGSDHLGFDRSSHLWWATASFLPSTSATTVEANRFEDGGGIGIFTSPDDSHWTMTRTGGLPFPCGNVVPGRIRLLWGLHNSPYCAGTTNTTRQSTSPTSTSPIAQNAELQVGVGDNPTSTDFSRDCNPFTTLANPGITTAGCGTDPVHNVLNSNEEWCADFAKWDWQTSGVTVDLGTLTAGARSFYAWGRQVGDVLIPDGNNPAVGDAVVFYPKGDLGASGLTYADHVGLVVGVNPNGTVNLVNGDFVGPSNITVQQNDGVSIASWAASIWNPNEQWVYVAPTTASVVDPARADFNGDHRDDLAWIQGSTLTNLRSNLNGTFTNVGSTVASGPPTWAGVGNFTGNGLADVAWYAGGVLSLYQPVNNGQFALVSQTAGLPPPTWAGVGNFNTSGLSGIAWYSGTTLSDLQSTGTGTFSLAGTTTEATPPTWAGVGNFNTSGLSGIAWYSGTTLSDLQSTGTGTFSLAGTTTGLGTPTWASNGSFPVVPTFTSPSSATLTVSLGASVTVATTPTLSPVQLTESGSLPAGVGFTDNQNGTATISGVPTSAGSYPVTITATNSAGSSTQRLLLKVGSPGGLVGTTDTGYDVATSTGRVFNFGAAVWSGSTGGNTSLGTTMGFATTPDGLGYWLATSTGRVLNFGDAPWLGSEYSVTQGSSAAGSVVALTPTPDGAGYWILTSTGRVFNFGDAPWLGSEFAATGGSTAAGSAIALAATPDHLGYWILTSTGRVFNFGDAVFFGCIEGATALGSPVDMTSSSDGSGYLITTASGRVLNFGDAGWLGSPYAQSGGALGTSAVSLTPTPDHLGYLVLLATGAVVVFGDAANLGAPASLSPASAVRLGLA